MPRHIEHPIKLALLTASIIALAPGCVLDLDQLDAGQDDSAHDGTGGNDGNDDNDDSNDLGDVLECLIGTEIDATAIELSSWAPQCNAGVVCAEGWGHDGEPLPIAWTSTMQAYPPGVPFNARAIGIANGYVIVAIVHTSDISLMFFAPEDGVNTGGYAVEGFGSLVHGVEIDSGKAYVTHSEGDGIMRVSAIDIGSQQLLWTVDFAADWGSKVARGGSKLALTLWSDPDPDQRLVVLDLDGNLEWEQSIDTAHALAISPLGDRIAASGALTRIYDADDGELLTEFDHLGTISAKDSLFLDQDRVAVVGSLLGASALSGWLSLDSLAGGNSWEHGYDRASSWCADQNDESTRETNDAFAALTQLSDGSLVAVGSESFVTGGVDGSHPWVAHFSADGEFLGKDRGLWNATAVDTVAGQDGSVYVLIAPIGCADPCEHGSFAVRKYDP